MKRGDILELDVVGLTPDGDGVAHLEDRTIAVAGAFPGEHARTRVTDVSRQHARAAATTLSVLRPAPGRRPVPCHSHVAHGGACTGCPLMELDETAQRALKRRMLQDNFGLCVADVEGAVTVLGYRQSAKRVAFGARGQLRLGSFARGTHRPAPMWGCLVDHPRITDALSEVAGQASRLGITAYDEATATGDLRYVWAKTDGQQTIVTLITAEASSRAADALPGVLPTIDGLLHSVQGGRTNVIRGSEPRLLQGKAELQITLLGERIGTGGLGFLQPNPAVAARAYEALIDAQGGALALDLYAGAGLTTRLLRRTHREVVPCELAPESARALGVTAQGVEAFLSEWVSEPDRRVPGLVVANPPRQGLGERVCALLSELGAPRLHIMSCGPEGLARDLGRLATRYELTSLRAFDTLPQTPHVELVAHLALRP